MKNEFEKTIPIPYYQQLQIFIKERVANQYWKYGDFLPSERELCKEFDISRTTLRKSIYDLVKEKIIKKIPGRGYVINILDVKEFEEHVSFYKHLVSKGFDVQTKILKFKKGIPPIFLKNLLELKDDDDIFTIKRLRIVNGEPWYFIINYMPVKNCPGLVRKDLENISLFDHMKNKYNLPTFKTRRYIYAVNANAENARLLDIKLRDPILIFENVNYDKNNNPIESSISFCRCDKIIFESTIFQDRLISIVPKEKDSVNTINVNSLKS